MKRFFITSTGTGIGKTLVITSLCYQLRQQGKSVHTIKPLISGWEDGAESDTTYILQSLGLPITAGTIARISPWRFSAPLSLDMAASQEGRTINTQEVVDFCKTAEQTSEAEYFLIEGAGGIMVPINTTHTLLDVIKALDMPVILVTGSYLGSISHTLTAITTLEQAGIKTKALIISETAGSHVKLEAMAACVHNFTDIPIATIPFLGEKPALWQHAPDMTSLLAD